MPRPTALLACLAAGTLAACAAAPPPTQPEVIVYVGPHDDPRYQIPEHLKGEHAADNRRRMMDAIRFQQEGEALLRRMERDPDFGGLVFRHQPEPHAIVMFTGDAAAKLSRYTSDPRYRPVSVDFALAELERQKDVFAAQLSRLGIRCFSVDGDEEHNRVTVGAPPAELQRLRAAIASRALQPPPKLHLVEQGCPQLR